MPLGNQLTALLKEHISIAGKIRAARGTLLTFTDVWFKNADQIAALLYHLNPQYWSYDEMQKMMHHHLKITTAEVLAVLHGGSGAGAYDEVHQQAMEMADMLTVGIQKQFGRPAWASG